jgi:galactosamine-6-phosphate isomerase
MRIVDCEEYASLSARAGAIVVGEVAAKRDLSLCAATGRSPAGLYAELVRAGQANPGLFDQLTVVQLDEWGGVPPTDPGSCGYYLRTRLLEPLGVPAGRYLGFAGTAPDPTGECERVRAELERRGPIDMCVLGVGVNGHVGFNEPGPSLIPHCHVAQLSESTRSHAVVRALGTAPRFGFTLGLQEILRSRRIVLLVAGEGKREVAVRLLSGRVSTTLPASFLWLHGNVDCLLDRHVLDVTSRPVGAVSS